jgi:hypothetical protein
MKRVLLAVAILALAIPALRQAEARVDVSIDFFYDNLSDGGSWIEVGDYGYCWQPSVAAGNTSWRPYTDGYWAYTDQGWTWISYEDFGWATYHYGRWIRLRGRGWVWVPGREWGPAWVSWRTGGDYVGWAPLPPRRAGEYWDESPITARVDIDFDIGPASYNFIDVRYIGEPVLRERIYAPEQNMNYITKTVNVTNITYNNSVVYNYGPDYNTLSRYSTRPIQRLSLQRETNVDPAVAAKSKSIMKIEGDKLMVAAPQQFQKPTKPVAPKVVKERIAQAPVERGWEPVGDQKAQTELKEKIKKEDPKSVPPPTMQASDKAATSPGASMTPPAAGASSTPAPAATSPAPMRDKGKKKQKDNAKPSGSVPPVDAAAAPAVAPKSSKEESDKHKYEFVAPPPAAPRVAPPASPPDNKPNKSGPDSTKAETILEKPRHERPTDLAPKMNEQPPTRDEAKKQKKNEPTASPTP